MTTLIKSLDAWENVASYLDLVMALLGNSHLLTKFKIANSIKKAKVAYIFRTNQKSYED